jgi:Zonular occludens toxin (Zot)
VGIPVRPLKGFLVIRLVTGPLGTGKSYYGVRKATDGLREGKLVVTNFAMSEGWVDAAIRHGYLFKNSAKLDHRVELARRRHIQVSSLEELMKVRVGHEEPWAEPMFNADGTPWLDAQGEQRWRVKEGSCIVILDEAHRWMNARSWSQKGREGILNFFALARKNGFVVYLIAQRAQNMDVQVRELFEDHIRLNNLKRSVRVYGIPIVPFNAFIATWWNHAYPDAPNKYERYRLDYRKNLYDTMDTGSFGQPDDGRGQGVILIPPPRGPGPRPDAPTGGASAAPAAGAPAGAPAGSDDARREDEDGGWYQGDFPTAPDPALGS